VKRVRNLTDVDGKTIRRAREEGRPLADVTRQWTAKFHADCAALNCLAPHVEPTATGYIKEQVDIDRSVDGERERLPRARRLRVFQSLLVRRLQAASPARERTRAPTWLRPRRQISGRRRRREEDVSDFALWKSHKPDDGDNAWESPRGSGRPGWHIECSAMSKALLGDTIDLHTGGVDLLFPHHENEIAQSQCCNGTTFSRHWYHSEHLLVDGKKMSKSLGNLYTLDDLVAKGFSPMALRVRPAHGPPRKQLNFTLDSLHAAESAMTTLHSFWQSIPDNAGRTDDCDSVFAALHDDLDTPGALGALFTIVKRGPTNISKAAFEKALFALGLKPSAPNTPKVEVPAEIAALAAKRSAAKQAKDFAAADSLRKELAAAGWSMLDSKTDYKLEPVKK